MLLLSDLERKQFMIAAAKITESKYDNTGTHPLIDVLSGQVVIKIPEDPQIFINKEGRSIISDPEGPLARQGFKRWAAGGLIHILILGSDKKLIPLIMRDKKASTYPNYLCLPSGLSDNYDDFFNPTKVALKEGFEEIAITVDGKLVVPSMLYAYENLLWKIHMYQRARVESFGIKLDPFSPSYIDSRFVRIKEEKNFFIFSGKRYSAGHTGLSVYDSNSNGLDFIKIVETQLYTVEGELSFLDCEGTKSEPLNRQIFLFDADRICLSNGFLMSKPAMVFESGKEIELPPCKLCGILEIPTYPLTPTAYEALQQFIF